MNYDRSSCGTDMRGIQMKNYETEARSRWGDTDAYLCRTAHIIQREIDHCNGVLM